MSLSTLSSKDQHLFNKFGRGYQLKTKFSTIHEAFLHHALAEHASDTPAIRDLSTYPPREVTYSTLLKYARFIALQLKSQGIKPGAKVPLVAKRGVEFIAGILGTLMCGAQYVPLDGSVAPDATLRHVTKDSGSRIIVCLRAYRERVTALGLADTTIVLEDMFEKAEEVWEEIDSMEQLCEGDASSGCYVVYTSGTTGTPKGVDVSHGNVTNLVCQAPGNLRLKRGSRCGQVLSINFDMAAWEVLGTMSNGATLIIRGSDWKAALKEIDTLICTPSILAKYEPADFPNIKVVATAGEPCPERVAEKWAAHGTYYNCCGPTEVTIVNTMHEHRQGATLSIGKPIPNNNVYILNDKEEPVAIGEVGVMWGGGACVSRGYVNLPEKTAEKFRQDKFVSDRNAQMYNTGDLGRWLPDGSLECLGRVDEQVKIKGFRVELDGISASLNTSPGVDNAFVIVSEGELIGFLSPRTCNVPEIRKRLETLLPYYAIPTKYHLLDKIPLTSNGKADKRALKAIHSGDSQAVPPPPQKAPDGPPKEKTHNISMKPETANDLWSLLAQKLFAKDAVQSEKTILKPVRGFGQRASKLYRQLTSISSAANMAGIFCIVFMPSIERKWLATIPFANILLSVLARQELGSNYDQARVNARV